MKVRSAILLVLASPFAHGEVRLPRVFSDGAVLQRDQPVAVWGWSSPDKKVTVRFAGQEASTTANSEGHWQVRLPALQTSAEGRTLEVSEEGANTVAVRDVLVGEVWLASGQSNMEWNIAGSQPSDQEAAKAKSFPALRFFQVPKKLSAHRLEDVDASWQASTPETVPAFSAVAYFFARQIHEQLGVPVGILHSSWGGSRIEPWFAEEGFAKVPDLAEMKHYREARISDHPTYLKLAQNHLAATRSWLDQAEASLQRGKAFPPQPATPPTLPVGHNEAIGTYQAMIHPLVPYGLRGFLWYQGESNVGEGMLYTKKMEVLIHGWRHQFLQPEAPFLFVQLAPFNYGGNREGALQEIWAAQREVLRTTPHTGMAVINDIGNVGDIHPRNKSEVGNRLARWALAQTYGKPGIEVSGPLYRGLRIDGPKVILEFNHASGLKTRDGKAPSHFEVAGADWNFKPAAAVIEGQTIVLTSPEVAQPRMARFAWSQTSEPNLCNDAGLPAPAFHTHWPDDPLLGRNVAFQKPFTSTDPNPHGWNAGLTDGNWHGAAGTCFATGKAPGFPKSVTIDLGRARDVQAARFGVPAFGSTKTVGISLSFDGKEFREVERHEFAPKTAQRHESRFEKQPARFVRATFLDHYDQQDQYDPSFGFLSELEVYGPADAP